MKNLKDRIFEHKNPNLSTRLIIIAIKDEIREALEFGYSLKDVWKQLVLEKKISCSYATFTKAWLAAKELKTSNEGLTPIREWSEETEPKIVSIPSKPFSYENLKGRT